MFLGLEQCILLLYSFVVSIVVHHFPTWWKEYMYWKNMGQDIWTSASSEMKQTIGVCSNPANKKIVPPFQARLMGWGYCILRLKLEVEKPPLTETNVKAMPLLCFLYHELWGKLLWYFLQAVHIIYYEYIAEMKTSFKTNLCRTNLETIASPLFFYWADAKMRKTTHYQWYVIQINVITKHIFIVYQPPLWGKIIQRNICMQTRQSTRYKHTVLLTIFWKLTRKHRVTKAAAQARQWPLREEDYVKHDPALPSWQCSKNKTNKDYSCETDFFWNIVPTFI